MRLSILIATIGPRYDKFLALVEELTRQAEALPVEIVAYWNNGEFPIGYIRQSLMENAKGEYICFIDDDDWVPDYYVAEILANLGKDYIGFQVELYEDGHQLKPVYHSIKYGIWHEDDGGFYRGVTHLNPIKKELAIMSRFTLSGAGEDNLWALNLTPYVCTENYIDKVMYYYRHDIAQSEFASNHRKPTLWHRPKFKHPQFRWHPESKLKGTI